MTAQAAAQEHPAPGHEAGLSRGMAGMVLFIGSEVMLFGALFAGYFYVRSQAAMWPPEGVKTVDWTLGLGLTTLLVLSGIVAHFGVVSVKAGSRQGLVIGVGLAIVMGSAYIA